MIDDVANAVSATNAPPLPRGAAASPPSRRTRSWQGFEDRAPRLFVRFLQALVKNRRQMLIPEIANEYRDLVDEVEGRVHAQVTLAKPSRRERRAGDRASAPQTFGKHGGPACRIDPAILGGIIVRVGDRVMDGSVRRRLVALRSRLILGAR